MTTTVGVIVTADACCGSASDADSDCVQAAARRLYDAEIALHIAHQTRVDAWIAAASERLHDAVVAHRQALHAA